MSCGVLVGVNPLAFPPRCDPPAGLEIPPCSDQSPRGKDPKDITRRLGLGEAPRAATPSPLLTASLRCLGGRHRVFKHPNVAFLQRPFGPKSAWQSGSSSSVSRDCSGVVFSGVSMGCSSSRPPLRFDFCISIKLFFILYNQLPLFISDISQCGLGAPFAKAVFKILRNSDISQCVTHAFCESCRLPSTGQVPLFSYTRCLPVIHFAAFVEGVA